LLKDGEKEITWNVQQKVKKVRNNEGVEAKYYYDVLGNRVLKTLEKAGKIEKEHYVRETSGNILAVYQEGEVKELPIYGSARLGIYNAQNQQYTKTLGNRSYELSNHLGNVLTTISDNKISEPNQQYRARILSQTDYYAFGLPMPSRTWDNLKYRYGFNGKEKDKTIEAVDFGGRVMDDLTGRWWSVDPQFRTYSSLSPYIFVANMPIIAIDPDGERIILIGSKKDKKDFKKVISYMRKHSETFDNVYKVLKKSKERTHTIVLLPNIDFEKTSPEFNKVITEIYFNVGKFDGFNKTPESSFYKEALDRNNLSGNNASVISKSYIYNNFLYENKLDFIPYNLDDENGTGSDSYMFFSVGAVLKMGELYNLNRTNESGGLSYGGLSRISHEFKHMLMNHLGMSIDREVNNIEIKYYESLGLSTINANGKRVKVNEIEAVNFENKVGAEISNKTNKDFKKREEY
jgi:RHS repeat-associated protein